MNNPFPSEKSREGLEAIRRGDISGAYKSLASAYADGDRNPETLLGLSFAAREQSDFELCRDTVDQYLRTDPGHIHANIIKGDALYALGQERAAINFYAAALTNAPPPNTLPQDLVKELYRAQDIYKKTQEQMQSKMFAQLEKHGLLSGTGTSRVEQSVDIMLARKQAFVQQPTKFYVPELAQIQFFDTGNFEWAREIEAATDDIQAELDAILTGQDALEPYVAHNPIAPVMGDMGLNENNSWSSFHLVRDGKDISENIAKAPRTFEAINKAPIARIPGRSPNILFSVLEPGAHIPPHHGQINIRLLCHLPLIAPSGCWLRVGNQTRDVKRGEMMMFDDSIEHEARNESAQRRVVLIFDIWRPEFSLEERETLGKIFEAIEAVE